jgi:hypothetical protein
MQVPLFGVSQAGKSRTITAQRHINLYAEIAADADKSTVSFYGTPGLTLDYSYGDTPVRGSIAVGDYKYEVHRGTLWRVDNSGNRTIIGVLATSSGRVEMAYNGTQIAIADGVRLYCLTIATGVLNRVSSGLFDNPISVTFGDSYFIVGFRNGRFQISSSYDGNTFDALDYATAESNPDGLLRVIYDHGELILLGDVTVEFWSNTGGQDFPYSNIKGSTLEFGLASQWSLTKFNDSLAGLFRNAMGQVQAMVMTGHALQPISKPNEDYIFNGYSSVADATGYSYLLGGHPMFQLNFPLAGKSWLFDALTGMWTQLESGLNSGRHRGEIRTDYLGKQRITDFENGNVYTLNPDVYTDNGMPIVREIISRHTFKDAHRMQVSFLQVEFEPGVGLQSGQGSDPQAMLQISRNGGQTYGNELWTTIGPVGEYTRRAMWWRLGMSRDFTFKIRITDPVKVVISNGYMDAKEVK